MPDGEVERRYSPRADVTIVRDKGFGVPHIYGATRDGAMFGLGYAAAEDRLFFMDALRHAGRGAALELRRRRQHRARTATSGRSRPTPRPTSSARPSRRRASRAELAATIASDADNYIAGINQYITEAQLDPTKMPGEYAAIGHPQGPEPWKRTDLVATASLVGGIFGKGGGNELAWTQVAHALDARFGSASARKRRVQATSAPPRTPRRRPPARRSASPTRRRRRSSRGAAARSTERGLAAPARRRGDARAAARRRERRRKGLLDGLLAFPTAASNALLVSARESASGKPLMVAGPQVAYFNPQILMEQDVHAPAAAGKPGHRRARRLVRRAQPLRPARPRARLRVERDLGGPGQHRHVRASRPAATTCTTASAAGACRSRCSSASTVAAVGGRQRPPRASETLRAQRTKLGLVAGRASCAASRSC